MNMNHRLFWRLTYTYIYIYQIYNTQVDLPGHGSVDPWESSNRTINGKAASALMVLHPSVLCQVR